MRASFKEAAARCRAFLTRSDLDRDFGEELESHLTMLIEENVRRGMSPESARRAALIRMGSPALLKEQHRTTRGLPALDSTLQDVRFAFRLIGRNPWFSAAAIVALALGIGVNAIGFTIVNAAFLRGLPFEDADKLHVLTWQGRPGRRSVSYADLQDWRAQSRTFTDLAGYRNGVMNVSDDRGLPEQVRGTWVTANAFGIIPQQPLLGRDFAPGEDHDGATPVVLIAYSIWKNRYGADPRVLGATLRVNGEPATIVGVMPDGMRFPDNTDVWAPFIPTEQQKARNARVLNVFGRLRDGTTRAEAKSELDTIAQRLSAAYPETYNDVAGVRVETFTERHAGGGARIVFLAAMGAVSLVLLVACANVASLLLSRSAHRAREVAMRLALGATRWRIVRQLLIESVVLGCLGGGIGLLLASAGVRMVNDAVDDPGKPYWIIFTLDYVVLGYVTAICVLTGVLCGLTPALHVVKTSLNDVLKDGGRGTAGNRRVQRLSGVMVIAELALTIVLLAGAGLLVRSFMKLYTLDIGIRTDHLMTMRMELPGSKYADAGSRRAFFERVEPRLAAISGIEAIALTTAVPPFGSGQQDMEIEGRPAASGEPLLNVSTVTISPRFFEVADVSLRRGRPLRDTDGAPGSETVVINERMAAEFFPSEDPIGRRLRFIPGERIPGEPAPAWRTIVGISPTIRQGSPDLGGAPNAVVYLPFRQDPPTAASLLIRSHLPPSSVMDEVRRAVQAIDPDQPVFTIRTLDQLLAQDRWPFRLFGALFAGFALVALLLSSLGVYAVMAYSVAQRTQEIGIRMAFGADARQMSWLVLRRGMTQLAIGLALGLPGALALSQVLQAVLVQITPADPLTYLATTMVLTIACMAACLLPAHRATRVDPAVALRAE